MCASSLTLMEVFLHHVKIKNGQMLIVALPNINQDTGFISHTFLLIMEFIQNI
jgi:hypothetical protein